LTLPQDRLVSDLCDGLRGFWRDTGRTRGGLAYLPWGIEAAERVATTDGESADRRQVANIAVYYGDILKGAGRLSEAEQAYQQDVALRQQIEDQQGVGVALSRLGVVAQQRGQLEAAERYYQQSLAICREVQDRQGKERHELTTAEAYHRKSLAISVEVQNGQDIADSL
jgi:tetratricopeptide (TPR) repeat protein